MDESNTDRSKEPLINVRQAAEFLGMGQLKVRRMAHEKQLPAFAFSSPSGRHTYRFRFSELESFLDGLRHSF